jgi:hypothetical protein
MLLLSVLLRGQELKKRRADLVRKFTFIFSLKKKETKNSRRNDAPTRS